MTKYITEHIQLDTDRLYGSLDVAIKYLQEIKDSYPDAQLEEVWTGYEDMHMAFTYLRPETKEEKQRRLELARMQEKARVAEEKRLKQRSEDIKELKKLKAKLGII